MLWSSIFYPAVGPMLRGPLPAVGWLCEAACPPATYDALYKPTRTVKEQPRGYVRRGGVEARLQPRIASANCRKQPTWTTCMLLPTKDRTFREGRRAATPGSCKP